jgi:hypothetical protein
MRNIGVGFSFRGTHTDELNVTLGNNDESMHALVEDLTYNSEDVDGYDGAYPLGSQVKQRDFDITLICEDFTDRDLMRVAECFAKDAYGQLIFDHRPYKYYIARVTSSIKPPSHVHFDHSRNMFLYSGTMTVKLTAFTPYAYAVDEVVDNYPNIGDMLNTVNSGTGIVEPCIRPAKQYENLSGVHSCLLLNQGNAKAKCDVIITGSNMSEGLVIENETTGDSFIVSAPDDDVHTYIVSAVYGRTTEIVGGDEVMADDVKIGGFITLTPCGVSHRGLKITADGKSNSVAVSPSTEKAMMGKHIYVNGGWRRITGLDGNRLILDEIIPAGEYEDSVALKLNKIKISCGISTISSLQFVYKDTFY